MKRKSIRRLWQILLSVALVVVIAVAVPVYARYIKKTDMVTNTFSPADTSDPVIEEEFDKETKTDVRVSVGELKYPVYVRVSIVVTWKDSKGIVFYQKPSDVTDYQLELVLEDWDFNKEDGYYYYKYPVPSNGTTSILIKSCTQRPGAKAPDGYTLSVEIIAQTVQAVGFTDGDGSNPDTEIPAYQDAWETSWTPKEKPDTDGEEQVEP